MRFMALDLAGVVRIEVDPVVDQRGYFARYFDDDAFSSNGLELTNVQCAVSHNIRCGTLRGLHFCAESEGEAKLVRCTRGRIFDVVADLRPTSPTYGKWTGIELSETMTTAIYIPRGCAHGFVTLEDNVDVSYQFSMPFRPGVEKGVRWNDPSIAVEWPIAPTVISQRDQMLPTLKSLMLA